MAEGAASICRFADRSEVDRIVRRSVDSYCPCDEPVMRGCAARRVLLASAYGLLARGTDGGDDAEDPSARGRSTSSRDDARDTRVRGAVLRGTERVRSSAARVSGRAEHHGGYRRSLLLAVAGVVGFARSVRRNSAVPCGLRTRRRNR
jgi:hypothetical protein